MLNVVIVGAGDVGIYVAQLLSKEQHNVILVDKDAKRLEEVSAKIDVAVRKGSGTDWQLLDDLLDLSPDFFLSLTTDDEVNLTACSIAKNLGYPKTIARVRDNRFLNKTRLDFYNVFDVDYFICPEILVANDIQKYIFSQGAVNVENFAHGAVELRTITIPDSWNRSDTPIKELNLPEELIIGLIYRQKKGTEELIFPHGETKIFAGDEVTCIGEKDTINNIHTLFGTKKRKIQSIVMIGGSLTAYNLAKMVEKEDVFVRIIEKNYDKCVQLADKLQAKIIHQDGTNLEFLLSERIDSADLVIACTGNDDVNMMAALMAKEAGSQEVVVLLSRQDYQKIAQKLGISFSVSKRLATANSLLSLILSSRVTSCVSLYDNRAEVAEIQVSLDSKIVGIPIDELGPLLPKDFLITVIQNRGRILMAKGNRILSPGDSVIVVTNPRHIEALQKVF